MARCLAFFFSRQRDGTGPRRGLTDGNLRLKLTAGRIVVASLAAPVLRPFACLARSVTSHLKFTLRDASFNSIYTPKIGQLDVPFRWCSGGQECLCAGRSTPSV